MPVLYINDLIDDRVEAIRNAASAVGGRVELGVSGGIDSAVMLCLAVLAVGADNTTASFQDIHSSKKAEGQATAIMEAVGVKPVLANMTEGYEILIQEMLRSLEAAGYDMEPIQERIQNDPTVLGSIRSCLRAPLGRGFNRMTGGGLRLGTGNECEDRWLRFYQKGGDGEVDCNPMAMLSKGEVYQLAVGIGNRMGPAVAAALRPCIEVAPEHDLWAGKDSKDEGEIKTWTGADFTYSKVDPVTGKYTSVGTIERVSRFLDVELSSGGITVEDLLFGSGVDPSLMNFLARLGQESVIFSGVVSQNVGNLLRAAQRIELGTRHKMNPNCPMYGSREKLLNHGILTNLLPFQGYRRK